jgi:hypothetical protein
MVFKKKNIKKRKVERVYEDKKFEEQLKDDEVLPEVQKSTNVITDKNIIDDQTK